MGGTRHWRGADEYTLWTERREKWTKGERRWARCSVEKGARTNLGGGGKEGTQIISEGKHRTLKIGTESRGNHSLCSGLELHHPIMSKLWNLGGQTQRRKKERKICMNRGQLMVGRMTL